MILSDVHISFKLYLDVFSRKDFSYCMDKIISWHLPIKTASEANSSEHWSKKWKRHKTQKKWVKAFFLKDRPKIDLPVHVVLTRIAPRLLDSHDNLPASLKWIADEIAANIIPGKKSGRADDSKEISWEYRQEQRSPFQYGVQIEILS